ncbi:hypothetical protein [Bacillus alveayuensis]|uniref:UPF0738 family protein n=1 Tax=Aeribacillus alveayuensis TaxID=279215 RepID=UPI0005D0EFE4|nr:hypothetical protein [Bacillus alveayuensis]
MKKRMEVKEAIHNEEKLLLKVESLSDEAENLHAKGQMLADSDQLAFIYLLDNGEDFVYLSVPSSFWPALKEAREHNLPVYAVVNGKQIFLQDFHTELDYLIENIKGNANYGEEMEKKVTDIFQL